MTCNYDNVKVNTCILSAANIPQMPKQIYNLKVLFEKFSFFINLMQFTKLIICQAAVIYIYFIEF